MHGLNTGLVRGMLGLMFISCLAACAEDTVQPLLKKDSGAQWVLQSEYSDEFNGTKLDSSKWDSGFL